MRCRCMSFEVRGGFAEDCKAERDRPIIWRRVFACGVGCHGGKSWVVCGCARFVCAVWECVFWKGSVGVFV